MRSSASSTIPAATSAALCCSNSTTSGAGSIRRFSRAKAICPTYYALLSIAKRTHEISAKHFAERDNDRVAVQVLSEAIEFFLLELRSVPGITRALEENAAAVGNAVSAVAEKFGQQ